MIRWVARLVAAARKRYGGGMLLAGLAVAIAATVRLGPILIAPFPLGDGGLFATMADDIRAAGFGLPATTSYNGGGIPFAYPPLGLYVLAAVPGDPISTERWLPLVWSLAAVVAAWSLARELSDAHTAGVAAVVFAAMPITWAIEGGGVTRGLGFLLLLVTVWSAAVTTRRPTVPLTATTGILASLALLAHPAVGPALVALGTLLLARRWSRRAAIAMTGAVGIALLGIAPWLWLVLSRHGPEPLLTAATSHAQAPALVRLLAHGPSWLGPLDITLAAALVGLAIAIRVRQWFLPAWIIVLLVVPSGEGRYSALAWAMLAATGALAVEPPLRAVRAVRAAATLALSALVLASMLAGFQRFRAIPTEVRLGMIEVSRTTPAAAAFAVQTGAYDDGLIEWFPVLAKRVSIGTYMGLEWTSADRWEEALRLNGEIQRGEIPASADYLFRVSDGVVSIEQRGARQ
jgi:hypothetical protein